MWLKTSSRVSRGISGGAVGASGWGCRELAIASGSSFWCSAGACDPCGRDGGRASLESGWRAMSEGSRDDMVAVLCLSMTWTHGSRCRGVASAPS